MAAGGVPVAAVGHDDGEYILAVAVGVVHGLVAGGEFSLSAGVFVVAVALGGVGFGLRCTAASSATSCDVPADHAGLLFVPGMVGPVPRGAPQGRELRLYAVNQDEFVGV
jgi:hypothetical protein